MKRTTCSHWRTWIAFRDKQRGCRFIGLYEKLGERWGATERVLRRGGAWKEGEWLKLLQLLFLARARRIGSTSSSSSSCDSRSLVSSCSGYACHTLPPFLFYFLLQPANIFAPESDRMTCHNTWVVKLGERSVRFDRKNELSLTWLIVLYYIQ